MASNKPFVYVGAEGGGLFRKAPDGGQWEELSNGLPPSPQVRSIVTHPADPRIVYAGTQVGPYRSLDRGDSWEKLDFPEGLVVWSFMFQPDAPDVMYLGTSECHVYRSDNKGDSWQYLSTISSTDTCDIGFAPRILALSADPKNPEEMFAALEIGGVARSKDGGRTWQSTNHGLAPEENRLDLHGVAATSGHVFISNREGVWRSSDGGDNWRNLQLDRFSPLYYSRGVRVAPDDPSSLYACVGSDFRGNKGGVLRSNDLGESWTRFDQGIEPESTTFGVTINARDPQQVYFCTRRGEVFGTEDGGATWNGYPLPDSAQDVISVLVASAD